MKLINEARVESDGDRNLPQFCALSFATRPDARGSVANRKMTNRRVCARRGK